MFEHLQIYDARERWMVGMADLVTGTALAPLRLLPSRAGTDSPQRILLLRLERIGDLLMALPAIDAVRHLAPNARLDLVVGSWNAPIARLLRNVDTVEVLDASWLARESVAASRAQLARHALSWRSRDYDVAINFEGDIRSHALMWLSGAPRRSGFGMAGGAPFLTCMQPYDSSRHVADNLLRLVERTFGHPEASLPLAAACLRLPDEARARAALLLEPTNGEQLIAVNVGGGRAVKQWPPERFADVVMGLAARYPARFLFIGADGDRDVVAAAIERLAAHANVIDLVGRADLVTLAAILERCALVVTGDTGPMHLAAAVGAPLVAVFGPSDARRWGPLQPNAEIVQADAACRPCNRIRRPPDHCVGRVPECLDAVSVGQVLAAAERQLARAAGAVEGRR